MKNLVLVFLLFFNLSSPTFAQKVKELSFGIQIPGKILKKDISGYRLRDLRKIRIGMSLRQVERKLGQKLKLEPEKPGPDYPPISQDFKITSVKGRDMGLFSLRFYKRQLYGVFVVYKQRQWANLKSLLRFVSKELNLRYHWKTLIKSGTLDMNEMYFRKYLIGAMTTGVDYTVYIENKKIMNRLRKQLKAKQPSDSE
jgi:hypothetical protein